MSVRPIIRSRLLILFAGGVLVMLQAAPLASHAQERAQEAGSSGSLAARGAGPAGPQQPASAVEDLQLVRDRSFMVPGEFAHYHGAGNNDKALETRHHNVIAQYNPVSLVLKGVLLGYQKIVSEQLARSCPYEITCSNFSKQAIQEFGVFKGVFLSADRILRCNRIGLLDVSPLSINPATGAIVDPPNLYR
jgi:putative component of membrane protein insertase Oxa1/YidC/SpoIIIJ protein YidD